MAPKAQGVERILVRACVHLPGLPLSAIARIDPTDPYMADLLRRQLVVPLEPRDEAHDSEAA
jgi:hypothetical protein